MKNFNVDTQRLTVWMIWGTIGASFMSISSSLYDMDVLKGSVIGISGVIALLIFLYGFLFSTGKIHLAGPMTLIIMIFIGWSALSLAWSTNVHDGLNQLLHFFICFIFFLIAANTELSKKSISDTLFVMSIFLGIIAALGYFQYIFGFDWIYQRRPPSATFINRNMAMQVVVMVLPLAYAAFFVSSEGWKKHLMLFVVSISVLYLFFSRTRAAWLSSLLSYLFFFITFFYQAEKKSIRHYFNGFWKSIIIFALFVGFSISLDFFAVGSNETHVRNSLKPVSQLFEDPNEFTSGRLTLYRASLAMILDRPLTGFGLNNASIQFSRYMPGEKALLTHNDYLQVAAELGVIGLILFSGIFFTAFRLWHGRARQNECKEKRIFAIAFLSGIIAYMVEAFFTFPLYMAVPSFLLFLFLGLLCNISKEKFDAGAKLGKQKNVMRNLVFCVMIIVSFFCVRVFINKIHQDRFLFAALRDAKANNWQNSMENAKKSLSYDNDCQQTLLCLGRAFLETGDTEKSVSTFKRLIELHPYDYNAFVNLGIAYTQSGNDGAAMAAFQRALELYPDNGDVYIQMANLYIMKGDYEEALPLLETAKGTDQGGKNSLVYFNLGVISVRQKKYEDAVAYLEESTKISPDFIAAREALIQIYLNRIGDMAKAREHILEYIAQNPESEKAQRMKRLLTSAGS